MIYKSMIDLKKDLSEEGRALSLDIGTKIIGVAISDSLRIISNPKLSIKRSSNQKDFERIKNVIIDNDIKLLVVGLPLNMDMSNSDMSRFVIRFVDEIDIFLKDVKIILFDERLSSSYARDLIEQHLPIKRTANKKELIDQISASVILQAFLDELRRLL